MPKFTALIYARSEDKDCLDRALESLKVANDVLLVNGDDNPEIDRIARRHRARRKNGIPGVTPGAYLMDAFHPWILILRPFETLSNDLIRSLDEWKKRKRDESPGYAFGVLQQDGHRWRAIDPELRLVNRILVNWTGEVPQNSEAPLLPGPLLRYQAANQEEERLAS